MNSAVPDVENYVGKTERTLYERSEEHGFKDKNSLVYNHIKCCEGIKHIKDLFTLNINDDIQINYKEFGENIVRDNLRIVCKAKKWDELLIKELLAIKEIKPTINKGLKASRELKLF